MIRFMYILMIWSLVIIIKGLYSLDLLTLIYSHVFLGIMKGYMGLESIWKIGIICW